MSTTSSQPLLLRMRPDLEMRSSTGRDQVWMVRDPVTLNFYRFTREEYELLKMLDGKTSLLELQARYHAIFSPQKLPADTLMSFLSRLYREGLLLDDSRNSTATRVQHRQKQRFQNGLARWSNPLAIRGPGVTPGPILETLTHWFGWLFSVIGFLFASALLMFAGVLVVLNWNEVRIKLPTIHSFFAGENLIVLLLVIACVKVCHELGHAIACRKYGGRCRRIGLMFLVFMPTLYCDVSDAWFIHRRIHRIIISAAGMYIEVLLASIATLLWWNSSSGYFHAVCLNVMLTCSFSTLFINGNPFLRFDGYYILSDLVNVPNLRQRSTAWWSRFLKTLCLGIETSAEQIPQSRQHNLFLMAYGILAFIFRLFVVSAILWSVYQFLDQYDLTIFFYPLIFSVCLGIVGPVAKRSADMVRNPLQRSRMKPLHVTLSLLTLGGLGLLIGFVPLPAFVYCPAIIEPSGALKVYAYQSGQMHASIDENESVELGETICRLKNVTLELEAEELRGKIAEQESRLKNLEAFSRSSPEALSQIPLEKQRLEDLNQQYTQLQQKLTQLEIVAQRSGFVFPPPFSREAPVSELDPQFFVGTPLDPFNHDGWIEAGTLLCSIGDPKRMEARLLVNEQQLQLLRKMQPVTLLTNSEATRTLQGEVVEIGRTSRTTAPQEFLPNDKLVIVPRDDGTQTLVKPHWEVRVEIPASSSSITPGLRGTARVTVDPMTLLTRLRLWFRRTFTI